MMDYNDVLPILPVVILVVVLLGAFVGLLSYEHGKDTAELQHKVEMYESFSVSGTDFKTSDVRDVTISFQGYANDIYIFAMTDGTRIEVLEGGIIWYKDDKNTDD